MDYIEYTRFIREITAKYKDQQSIFEPKCRKCCINIKKYWWFSLQIAPGEFWFYCSTVCMKMDSFSANKEYQLKLLNKS